MEGVAVVCVTGASGYIASWLVKSLLSRGYAVRATLRNLSDPTKAEHLKALEGAQERLQLFQADLTEEGSFDAAIDGCDGVFHTASPVVFREITNPQSQLIKPAVNGTLNVLRSCVKATTIKRVVLTSSMAAVGFNKNGLTSRSSVVIDETWYSDPAFCEELEAWYSLSKTLAEEAAWRFAEQHGMDLVVINPGLVVGRCLQPTLNVTSDEFLKMLTTGVSDASPTGVCVAVDIRDVVHAHILAFENPSAKGRYCLVAVSLPVSEIIQMARDLYPTLTLPNNFGDNKPAMQPPEISKQKVKSLGIDFIPFEQSLKDTIELYKERNLLVI